MFGGMANKLSMLRKKSTGGGGDVSIDITNINFNSWGIGYETDCTDSVYYFTQGQQITGINQPVTLKFVFINAAFPAQCSFAYKISSSSFNGGSIVSGGDPDPIDYGYIGLLDNDTITVNNNDYLGFFCVDSAWGGDSAFDIQMYNVSDNNTLLGTFSSIYYGDICQCFLTTAIVSRMGLNDDGPELNAMRTLREIYKEQEKELIREYVSVSPVLIENINKSSNPDEVYLEIYNVVKTCQSLVENEQYELAHDEYLNMYFNLKNRYYNIEE